jgi:predicted ferric reductase
VNPQIFWYTARATGIVAWVVLTLSVVWGLALSTRISRTRPKPGWVLDLHRYLGGTAVLYTGLHMLSLWADGYVRFDIADLFIPFASAWRPSAVAWGIAAFYLLVAVELTSLFKRRVGRRVWRVVHMSSFALLVVVWVHAFASGSDMNSAAARWFAFGSATVVLFLLAYRGLIHLRLPALERAPG